MQEDLKFETSLENLDLLKVKIMKRGAERDGPVVRSTGSIPSTHREKNRDVAKCPWELK